MPESEVEQYRHTALEIRTIPDEVAGISAVRNWVLRHFDEDAIVMLDDDISACVCIASACIFWPSICMAVWSFWTCICIFCTSKELSNVPDRPYFTFN